MDKKKMIIGAGLAVLAFVVFTQAQKLSQPTQMPIPQTETIIEKVAYQDILSASIDIPFGGRLSAENIQWKQWPEEAMSPEYISREDNPEALEQFLTGVAKSPIYAGEPISARRVVMAGDRGLMSALLTPGMRAVTTEITAESAAGGFIQPGDRVDIILTTEAEQLPGVTAISFTDRYLTETVFEDVRVLAIDQMYDIGPDGGASVIGNSATFEMNQEDAEMLMTVVAAGDLALILRPLTAAGTVSGTSRSKVRKQKQSTGMTVYRGGQSEQVAIRGN